jgi:hypothetical protein
MTVFTHTIQRSEMPTGRCPQRYEVRERYESDEHVPVHQVRDVRGVYKTPYSVPYPEPSPRTREFLKAGEGAALRVFVEVFGFAGSAAADALVRAFAPTLVGPGAALSRRCSGASARDLHRALGLASAAPAITAFQLPHQGTDSPLPAFQAPQLIGEPAPSGALP